MIRTRRAILAVVAILAGGIVWRVVRSPASAPALPHPAEGRMREREGDLVLRGAPAPAWSPSSYSALVADKNPIEGLANASSRLLELSLHELESEFRILLGEPKGGWRDLAMEMLLRRWGQVGHEAALAAVGSADGFSPPERFASIDAILGGWATAKPAEAWEWAMASLRELPRASAAGMGDAPGGSAEGRILKVVKSMIESSRYDAAAELLSATPNSATVPTAAAVTALSKAWFRSDPDAALTWAQAMHLKDGNPGGMAAVVQLMAESNLEAAKKLARGFAGTDLEGVGAYAIVVAMSDRRDRPSALRWLQETVGPNEKGAHDDAILLYFAKFGFVGTAMIDGPSERALLARLKARQTISVNDYIYWTRERAPAEAIEAILQFQSGNQRETNLVSVVSSWARVSPTEAANQVNRLTGLSDDLHARLLKAAAP